jgi:hypothetical protein
LISHSRPPQSTWNESMLLYSIAWGNYRSWLLGTTYGFTL